MDQTFDNPNRNIIISGQWTEDQNTIAIVKEFIINSVDDSCKSAFIRSDHPKTMLDKLAARYGGVQGKDPLQFKGDIKVFFPKHKNPIDVFILLDSKIAQLNGLGESLSNAEEVIILINTRS